VLGLLEDLPDPDAGGVTRAQVGAGLPQRSRDRVAHFVGHLGAAGGVEEGEPLPQRREASPDGRDVDVCTEHLGHRKLPPAERRPIDIDFTTASQSHSSALALAQTAMV